MRNVVVFGGKPAKNVGFYVIIGSMDNICIRCGKEFPGSDSKCSRVHCSKDCFAQTVTMCFELRENGFSHRDIAAEVNVHSVSVSRYLKRYNKNNTTTPKQGLERKSEFSKHKVVTYVIQPIGSQIVSIGKTTALLQRLDTYNRHCPQTLSLIGVCLIPEELVHSMFSHLRVGKTKREWFYFTEELQDFVDKHCSLDFSLLLNLTSDEVAALSPYVSRI